ncbi:MAG: hypothetical protein IID51_11740 [Proteobacteria bacterium]|nr:hypothetical protein [Pseudomonadota bacterium]
MKMFAAPSIYPIAVACAMAISFTVSAQDQRSNVAQFKQETNESVAQKAPTPYPREATFFFDKPPYVHPKIIQELSIWISDQEEAIVSINLSESYGTNRFHHKINRKTGRGDQIRLQIEDTQLFGTVEAKSSFSYELDGVLGSNIYVLSTFDWGGGSGIFMGLVLVRYECGFGLGAGSQGFYAIEVDKKNLVSLDRSRVLLTKMAEIAIGDRWLGDIEVDGDTIIVSENIGYRNDDYTDIIYDRKSFTIQAPPESTCNY